MSTLGAYFRLARVGWVLVREGVVLALPSDDLPAPAQALKALLKPFARSKAKRAQRSDRLATAVERLGPSYVKMGQFLATRPDVVGADFADDLASLQDRMAFFPAAAAKANIEGSLGRSVSDLYREFGDPIAAASIAQVHPAMVDTPKGPRKMAVKVIRPGVRQRFQNDLEAMYLIADLQQRFVRSARRLRPVEVTRTLEQTTKIEMDLRLEAAALSELAENTKDDPGFRVPEVDWERTGRDVVTMEWIDGVKMSDIEGLKAAGHDLNQLADTLIQSFLRHTLRDGFFHADMHPGNLFADPRTGDVIAVDFGIMGRINRRERRFLADILYGFITRNYRLVAERHFDIGYVPKDQSVDDFALAIRSIGEPLHGRTAQDISMARVLGQLFVITDLFNMQTRPELVLLQKSMVLVEGVARALDPSLDIWTVAEPVVGDWLRKEEGPLGRVQDIKDHLSVFAEAAQRVPVILGQAELALSDYHANKRPPDLLTRWALLLLAAAGTIFFAVATVRVLLSVS